MSKRYFHKFLDLANSYAETFSGCRKVKVGSVIINPKNNSVISLGANCTVPSGMCISSGCLREQLYGDNSKEHRNPQDCRAVHSEIDAIISAGRDLYGASIFITRYPCEACARAIVKAGICEVYYGREQMISGETKRIFDSENVSVFHISDWTEEDVYE